MYDRKPTESVAISHGVTSGDVTAGSAVIWARTVKPAALFVEYATDAAFEAAVRTDPISVSDGTDCTAQIPLSGLRPGTRYHYRVWATTGAWGAKIDPTAGAERGTFVTAPRKNAESDVSFVWSADTYGQGKEPPYQVPVAMTALAPDFFLYLGDTIYSDDETPAVPDGAPDSVEDYRAKYREVREQGKNLRELLRTTSVYAIWDDHEVWNNFAGPTEPLMSDGRQAFMEYWPIETSPLVTGLDPYRLYRSFRWGRHLELFILDTRQYRDDNAMPDVRGKTMLGEEQLIWLKESLERSRASFKLIASSVSLSSVSGSPEGRDSWASGGSETGFESELHGIIEFIQENVEGNVIWLVGDRHFSRVVSYDPDGDGQPAFYEAIAGPIGAATRDPADEPPDTTFNPTILYEEGGSYERGAFRNFGRVEVTHGDLTISVHDKVGEERFSTTIPGEYSGAQQIRSGDADTTSDTNGVVDRLVDHTNGD